MILVYIENRYKGSLYAKLPVKRLPNVQLTTVDTCRALVVVTNLVKQSKCKITMNLSLELDLNVKVELQSQSQLLAAILSAIVIL
jgi:hypothetical protein